MTTFSEFHASQYINDETTAAEYLKAAFETGDPRIVAEAVKYIENVVNIERPPPNRTHAVMAQRNPEDKESLDPFPTPPWGTRALMEFIINDTDNTKHQVV